MSNPLSDICKGDILVVDDKPENLRVLSSMLTSQGYKVRGVINGSMALKAAQSTPPDLILLDIMMPEMDGYQVCRLLKQKPQTQEIPIIFLSALDEAVDKVRAFQAGGVDYIPKPFQLEEVLARIETHLGLRAAQRQVQRMNLELEARVQQRTAQLQVTNEHLQQEILERKKVEAELRQMVLRDRLTGLPNRAFFMEHLQQLLRQLPHQPEQQFALLFLDCDGFKLVNDSLGHLAGDQLLIAIAHRLGTCLENNQILVRLGGDEFLVLMEQITTQGSATGLANRILKAFESSFVVMEHEIFINVSIGIVIGGADYSQPELVLRNADIAMYRAKALGKGAYQIFSPEMYAQVLDRVQLENALRRAIERQELTLQYQPIISLLNGQICGFEALLRWRHPERGWISPAKFIPIAEETGLIVPIGRWVLQTACTQLQTWQRQLQPRSPLYISINLSVKQLTYPSLIDDLDQILRNTSIHGQLTLELTESIMMQNVKWVLDILRQLKTRSIQVSIDDFGQGYSSLSYLHDFPVDLIKIDRAFVSGSGSFDSERADQQDVARLEIVKTIIGLAHNLGVEVVAEGIETAAQRDRLQRLGCEWGQGYFFSKPVAPEVVTGMIADLRHPIARL